MRKAKIAAENFGLGPWNVDFHLGERKIQGGKVTIQREVTMSYLGIVYFRSHGKTAYDNAIETVKHLHSVGYVPKSAGTVGADFGPGERARRSLRRGEKEVEPLEGLSP